MKSLLRPTFANALLYHFENQCLSDYPKDFYPNICRSYVDDIFALFNSHKKLKKLNLLLSINITNLFHSWSSKYAAIIIN